MVIGDSEGKTVALKNVLVGEVWNASGQSNMEWFASKSLCSGLAQELSKAKEELPIRDLRTDTVSALYPQLKIKLRLRQPPRYRRPSSKFSREDQTGIPLDTNHVVSMMCVESRCP
jgi:hypothetical protein